MLKMKRMRTADCVVGGFRYASEGAASSARCCSACTTTSGLLHHVGFTSNISRAPAKRH